MTKVAKIMEKFADNHIEYTDGGVFVDYIGKDGTDIEYYVYSMLRELAEDLVKDEEKIKEAFKEIGDALPERWIVEGYRARNQQVKDKIKNEWDIEIYDK